MTNVPHESKMIMLSFPDISFISSFLLLSDLGLNLDFLPIQNEDPKIFILYRGKNLYFIIKLATQISLFSLQISKT